MTGALGELNEELPDDVEEDAKYIKIPHKHELDLGKPLVLDFARECLPDDFDDISEMFSRRGGYRKFDSLLRRRKAVDRWHDFKNEATNTALRDWCELNSIEVGD